MENAADSQLPALQALNALFSEWTGHLPMHVQAIPLAGSDRRYYRLSDAQRSAIGVYSKDLAENKAFLSFSKHFKLAKVPVPEIYAQNLEGTTYLQQDLGDVSLLQKLDSLRRHSASDEFPIAAIHLYQRSLEELARMQIIGGQGLDYSLCVPRQDFDLQSIRWDLSYFKYYFLRAVKVPHDEQSLEDDFDRLAHWLLETDCSHFMFRDFQARNIMLLNEEPYFIDYQGGRRGAMQYDVASLLYQAKADLPETLRESLLDHYIAAAQQYSNIDPVRFKAHYRGYVLIRTLQVLGSYGFRGFFERRPHFLDSIPYALDNVRTLLASDSLPIALPTLWQALRDAVASDVLLGISRKPTTVKPLTVRIKSFSYKAGLPTDPSENGGGFVFDCRAVHNPGRIDAYKSLTGRDKPVIDYLEALPEAHAFFRDAAALVEASVRRYLERGFTDLMVSFGCTGGQHRSVYFADRLAKEIGSRFPVQIEVEHVQQEKKQWKN
ncbi:MAG: phosphotransferase [Bacteroidetes bacterium]|nr:phosphotransferase [Bacteroidota bacterium]